MPSTSPSSTARRARWAWWSLTRRSRAGSPSRSRSACPTRAACSSEKTFALALVIAGLLAAAAPCAEVLPAKPEVWKKLTPLEGGPPSPRLGYEGACAWDPKHRVLIRYGGHNQGGGGEQHSEVWTFDPLTAVWTLKEPDTSPPGVCCEQQDLFDPVRGRFIRFPSFSGSHGWQWWREIALNDSTVWTYDLATNRWRDLRSLPAPSIHPLRCASWDTHHQVAVVFGGEGSREGTLVYDPHLNSWTRMRPDPEPPARSGGNMAYDAARRLHVLLGAQFSDDPRLWTYDLRENRWRDHLLDPRPHSDQNDAVLAYDPSSRSIVAVVKITEGKEEKAKHRLETWVLEEKGTAHRFRKLEETPDSLDPSGSRARVLVAAPELGVVLLENRPHPPHGPAEQQVWALRLAPATQPSPPPAPPVELTASTTEKEAVLAWKRSPSAGVTGYRVERGTGEHPWKASFASIASLGPDAESFRDAGVERGKVHHYRVTALAEDGARSEPALARAQPPVVEDIVASVISAREVALEWTAPPGGEARGYHVERAAVEVLSEDQWKRVKGRTPPLAEPSVAAIRRIGPFARITQEPLAAPAFTDMAMDLEGPKRPLEGELAFEKRFSEEDLDPAGKPYRFAVLAYRVRAVNALGVEGGPSPPVFTIPSIPRQLFAREAKAATDLRWAPGREKGLRGHRVYRMDGRYDKDPIDRLTPEPIPGTTFTDPGSGKTTRRYHVVAVDALGQEGFPSAPVWHEREWKRFYAPFTGEWHQ